MAPEDAAAHPTDDFHQLKLLFSDPLQYDYEVIRPIVLFAEQVAVRSEQTGIHRSTVGEKARRFVQNGMLGLLDQRSTQSGRKPHTFPDPVARHILYLKQLYPPIHDREIVRIIERKFGYKTNHHTVKHFLARYPIPVQLPLAWTVYHEFEDAYRARYTVVRMYYEGWHMRSIAGCMGLSRQHVSNIIDAFERDGFAGLEDQRRRPPDHPANQLTLPLMKEIWTSSATTQKPAASACGGCSLNAWRASRRAKPRLGGPWRRTARFMARLGHGRRTSETTTPMTNGRNCPINQC